MSEKKKEEKQDSLVRSGGNLPTESPQKVGGIESIGVSMTPEIAERERVHAVSMAAELLNQRAAELRMNKPIDPNSRAAQGPAERDLVYAENRLMKAAMSIKFSGAPGIRCDSTLEQIDEFSRAQENYRNCRDAADKAKAIEGK